MGWLALALIGIAAAGGLRLIGVSREMWWFVGAALMLGATGAAAVVSIRPALAQTAASVAHCEIPVPDPGRAGSYIAADGTLVLTILQVRPITTETLSSSENVRQDTLLEAA